MLNIHIGWEGHYWWSQNEFSEVERSGDLIYSGLDVGARFDF